MRRALLSLFAKIVVRTVQDARVQGIPRRMAVAGLHELPMTLFCCLLLRIDYVSTFILSIELPTRVRLPCLSDGRTLTIQAPPRPDIFPPGYGWIYVVADDVPSEGKRVMVGDGRGLLLDERALVATLAQ